MYCVSDPYLISMMLLRSAKKGASGKAATNNVTNPYWITKSGEIAAIDYFCITINNTFSVCYPFPGTRPANEAFQILQGGNLFPNVTVRPSGSHLLFHPPPLSPGRSCEHIFATKLASFCKSIQFFTFYPKLFIIKNGDTFTIHS